MTEAEEPLKNRRTFLQILMRGGILAGLAGLTGTLLWKRDAFTSGPARKGEKQVWQLDPQKCIQCGRCATHCVLTPWVRSEEHTSELQSQR